jgi:hypothetical protein
MELQEQFPDVDIEIVLEDGLWDVVGRSDIVYTATSSPDYVIDKALLEANGLNGGRPLMLVDIAVPRNIGSDSKEVSVFSLFISFFFFSIGYGMHPNHLFIHLFHLFFSSLFSSMESLPTTLTTSKQSLPKTPQCANVK